MAAENEVPFPLQNTLENITSSLELEEYHIMDSLERVYSSCFSNDVPLETAGDCFYQFGQFSEERDFLDFALECYQVALDIWEFLGNKSEVAKICWTLSLLLDNFEDNYEKILYAQEGLKALEGIDSLRLKADLAIEMGNGLLNSGSYHRAEQLFRKAENNFEHLEDEIGVAIAHYGLGRVNYLSYRNDEAEKLITDALDVFVEKGDDAQLAICYNMLGSIWLEQNEYLRARELYLKGVEYAEKVLEVDLKSDLYINLTKLELDLSDTKAARVYYDKLEQTWMGTALDFSEDSEIKALNVRLENLEYRLRVKRNTITLIFCGILMVLALSFWFYRKKKIRAAAAERKKAEQEKAELKKKEAWKRKIQKKIALAKESAIVKGEREERKKLLKLVHNHIGSQLTAINWKLDTCIEALANNRLTPAELKQIKRMISTVEKASRNIENLLKDVGIDWLDRLRTFFHELTKGPKNGCQVDFLPHDLDSGLPGSKGKAVYEIIQIGISNSLRHAEASKINCQLSRVEDDLLIVMEDNGRGFEKKLLADGIGLKSLKELTKSLEGKEQIDSRPGYGTTISVACPFYN